MASGQFQNSLGSYGVEVAWESTANVLENTSTLALTVYVRYYSINIGSRTCRCTVNGQTQELRTDGIRHSGSSARSQVASFQFTLPHGEDGTARFPITVGFHFDLTSGSYGYIGWLEATGEAVPDAIPRAAILTATDGELGGNAGFFWTPRLAAHSFRLEIDTGKETVTQDFPAGTAAQQSFLLPLPGDTYLDSLTGTPPTATISACLTTFQGETTIGSSQARVCVTLPAYSPPDLTVTACHRATIPGQPDPAGEQLYLQVQVTGSPYPRNTAMENRLQLFLDAGTGPRELPLEDGRFAGLVEDLFLDTTQVYHLSLWAQDLTEASPALFRDIPTAAADFHLRRGGNGAAFGCYATREKALQLASGWTLYLGDQPLEDYIRQILHQESTA